MTTPSPATTETTDAPKKSRTNWYTPFLREIIQKVVSPKLWPILEAGVTSRTDLHEKFRAATTCSVSYAEFTEWLNWALLPNGEVVNSLFDAPKLIVLPRGTTQRAINRPQPMPSRMNDFAPAGDDDDLSTFTEARPSAQQPSGSAGSETATLPFQLPPDPLQPAVLDDSGVPRVAI